MNFASGEEVEVRRLYTGVQILRTAPSSTDEEQLIQDLGDTVEVMIMIDICNVQRPSFRT
jgi:hypothetical protein